MYDVVGYPGLVVFAALRRRFTVGWSFTHNSNIVVFCYPCYPLHEPGRAWGPLGKPFLAGLVTRRGPHCGCPRSPAWCPPTGRRRGEVGVEFVVLVENVELLLRACRQLVGKRRMDAVEALRIRVALRMNFSAIASTASLVSAIAACCMGMIWLSNQSMSHCPWNARCRQPPWRREEVRRRWILSKNRLEARLQALDSEGSSICLKEQEEDLRVLNRKSLSRRVSQHVELWKC
jgi:hypothetical protein